VIRTLIADDEPLARETIRVRLERERDVQIVGEVGDGPAAVEAIRRLAPDLVVLDIQMPGLDGFQVLERAAAELLPTVIFVTAYDRFAIRAFEVHAIDYLLKPVTAERLRKALDHVRRELARDSATAIREQMAALLDARAAEPAGAEWGMQLAPPAAAAGAPGSATSEAAFVHRITVRDGERFLILRIEEIDWIEAAANYTRIHTRGRVFQLRGTMGALQQRLDPARFARIHRSTIVNLDRVREIRPEWHGDFDVVLTDGTTLRLSRSYRQGLLGR
jgi:two-component system, LytTR family, response regulator